MIPAGSSPELLQRGIARAFCCVRRDRAQLVPLLFFLFSFCFRVLYSIDLLCV